MDILRQIIAEHARAGHNNINKQSAACADSLIGLVCPEFTAETDDVHKEFIFSAIDSASREVSSLNKRFKRALLDATHIKLFGQIYFSKPKATGFVDPKVSRAKALLYSAPELVKASLGRQDKIQANQRLFQILFFAAFESGLCFEEGLDALMTTVCSSKKILQKVGDKWVIRLTYQRAGHETNLKEKDNYRTQRIFYPAPLTTCSIIGYIKSGSITCLKQSATVLLKEELAYITGNSEILRLENKILLRAIAMSLSEQPGTAMPSFLRHYASGDISSASTSIECLQCLKTGTFSVDKAPRIPTEKVVLKQNRAFALKKTDLAAYHSPFNESLRSFFKQRGDIQPLSSQRKEFILNRLDDFFGPLQDQLTDTEFVLLDWLRFSYKMGNFTKFRSGQRDVSSVATIWLDVCSNISVFSIEQDEMSELDDQLMSKQSLSDQNYIERITEFLYFLSEQYDIPLPRRLKPRNKRKNAHVRSNIPATVHINKLFIDINEVYSDAPSHYRESVIVMLILMARTGLRPNEICNLQVKDVTPFQTGHIFVRTNRHYQQKTYSAKRLIELDTVLVGREQPIVRQFLARRMADAGLYLCTDGRTKLRSPESLLFSQLAHANAFFNMREISRHVTRFLTSYSGVPTPMYQTRHYFGSMIALACFASDEVINSLTPYTQEQAQSLRNYFQTHDSANVLYKIAGTMGHLEARITLSTYLHVLDLLLHESAIRSEEPVDISTVKSSTCVQLSRIKKHLPNQAEPASLTKKQLMQVTDRILMGERGQWAAKTLPGYQKRNIDMDSLFNPKSTFDAEQVTTVLDAVDKTRSADEIEDLYNIDTKMTDCVISAARDIKSLYKTNNKAPRLYESESKSLKVTKPRDTADTLEANLIISALMPRPMEPLEPQLKRGIHLFLSGSTHDHHYVPFGTKEINNAIAVIRALSNAVPKSRLFLEVFADASIGQDTIQSKWHDVFNMVGGYIIKKKMGGKRENGAGKGHLSFIRFDINKSNVKYLERNPRTHSSRALLYAFHTLAIYSKALQNYNDKDFR